MYGQSNLSDFGANSGSQPESYECEICGDVFDSAKGRGIHRANSHDEEKIKQVLITELQRLADELGRVPRQTDMTQRGAHSTKTYQKKFSSWNGALKQADFEVNTQRDIRTSELIGELTRLSGEIGRAPTSREMAENGNYGVSTYIDEFGSWNDAVQAAELEPAREVNINTEELLNELNRLYEKLGHTPTVWEMTHYGCYGSKTYTRIFGSWNSALEEAGLSPNKQQNIPESDLLDEICRLAKNIERTPSAHDMSKHGSYSVGSYARRFGTWNGALREAGFDVNNRSDIPKSELLTELQRLGDELDRTPTVGDMGELGKFGWATYETEFGSWNEAIQEAGLELNVRNDIPKAELIEEIHRLKAELGHVPERREMSNQGEFSGSAYYSTFGTWNNAIIEAGLEPNRALNPDHLDHIVRSRWELEAANLLTATGVSYGYEALDIAYGKNRTYTPDFVTEDYVIEVKGYVYGNAEEKAKTTIQQLNKREYVVVGTELPADIYIPWEERTSIQDLFR